MLCMGVVGENCKKATSRKEGNRLRNKDEVEMKVWAIASDGRIGWWGKIIVNKT